MHFRLIVLLFLFSSTFGFSSEKTNNIPIYWFAQKPDSIPTNDSIPAVDSLSTNDYIPVVDSVSVNDSTKKTKKKPFEDPIFSNAKDSTVYSLDGEKVYLYGEATVTYQNTELKAQYIEFNMDKKEVFAKGLPDSTGKISGQPVFKEGRQTYTMDDIYYNFDSKKAKITGVVTEQDGGFMHSKITKKMADNTVNLVNGKFTTCDRAHPHFYIAITKGKIIPNDKIIAGPAYLVIEDVPLPLGIPFGFFPNSRGRASGVIIPEYGEESRRGVFLRNGGYYLGISDYFDLKLTTDIYSFGSWAFRSQSNYRQKYKYSGNLGFNYSKNITDKDTSNSYSIQWTHSQDIKANPNSTFSASVNFQSTNNNKYNAQNMGDYLNQQINSSISYSRNFVGTPFRMNTSLTHSQNNITKIVSINFPRVSLNMDRICPLKNESSAGSPKWYEKIGFSLSSNLDNKVSVLEKNLFKPSVVDSMNNGILHSIPLSTSFNILKFIMVTPSINYKESWHTKTIRKYWNPADSTVVEDTIPGFRRAWEYNTAVSFNSTIYGMFNFGKDKVIQAIRHKLTPSISFSYSPDFSEPRYGFYKDYQMNAEGKISKYSIFSRGVNTGPGQGKSGSIGFQLGNNLEMKVRSSKDTVNNFKKIKIFESLNFSSSYNLLADSMKLQPISITGNTKLFEKVGVDFSGTLNPYALDSKGARAINKFEHNATGKLARLTNASISINFSLNSSKSSNTKANNQLGAALPPEASSNSAQSGQMMSTNPTNPQSVDFNIPWNLRVDYKYSYSKPGREKTITQALGFSGDLSLTPKWKVGFSSGYDFKNRKLTTTSVNIFRDLHCWEMRLTVIPIGSYKSYSFQINVKSGMLKDLKWSKRDNYIDNR